MSDDVHLRPAQTGEEEILSELCLRSKALWGYDAAFIAECAPYLKVTKLAVVQGWTTVAHDNDGRLLGVCQIDPDGHGGNLDLLFITPDAIGRGVGRRLFDNAGEQLKQLGHTKMTILSDPNAEAAYIHMGARRVEMRPSDVFKGRDLPWLEIAL
jgi:GNAT superfamily N-acetyltransferase